MSLITETTHRARCVGCGEMSERFLGEERAAMTHFTLKGWKFETQPFAAYCPQCESSENVRRKAMVKQI